ncbi:Aste57867_12309 [Aphanomyces stellatus]|uniref:Aste57867_12309 protein n=1 Tax=Aphanomyces stellatus TaxID=120398 RepID=A0A485KW09_9STRA|nr:hypothetical protein As57867_012263 [Aphanomyces stellatus]VFT89161.1 Aste57867_12309 [Aphanomyces stellatus]
MTVLAGSDQDRREYVRQKTRKHRLKAKGERTLLLQELAALQAQIPALPPPVATTEGGMLSWQTLADVFRSASRGAKDIHQQLKDDTDAHVIAVFEMMRFIKALRPRPTPQPLSPSNLIIANHSSVKLFASECSRTTAKQWLTQQLYSNTDRAFATFPHDTDDFACVDVSLTPSHINATEMSQAVFDAPLKTVLEITRRKRYWGEVLAQLDIESSGNTVLYRDPTQTGANYWSALEGSFYEADRCVVVIRNIQDDETYPSWTGANYWSALEGSFYEADRCVVVIRNIQDDETYPSINAFEHHCLQWLDLRQISPSKTLARLSSVRMICSPAKIFQDYPNPAFILPGTSEGTSVDSFPKDICDQFSRAYRVEGEDELKRSISAMRLVLKEK